MGPVVISAAAAGDEPGLVAMLAGLLAEDPGTRDPSVSQEWPRVAGLSSVTAWMADTTRLSLQPTAP